MPILEIIGRAWDSLTGPKSEPVVPQMHDSRERRADAARAIRDAYQKVQEVAANTREFAPFFVSGEALNRLVAADLVKVNSALNAPKMDSRIA
jgi:hypothetical protein